ncbi:hypothetical protein F4561_000673 [Lipingzhangella halophila]|uniref:DUF3054 domain-containing protein n=1 Tax=Lipingzhangella halophila TaxID=1783352 RepID=A0A7W7RD88_9ACTN|nr:DUF3054 domain-containing protein [Lipingzhangella halophila]MBB4929853.1 hypothetical protein [Lipingzhangella halophila]
MRPSLTPAAAALDLLCVLAFVAVGRAEHHGSNILSGLAATAWPFAAALLAGWLIARAWRAPVWIVPTGIVVWGVTVVGGMLLRVLGGGGTQLSFVVVTALFLGATMLGWRAAALLVGRRRRTRRPGSRQAT